MNNSKKLYIFHHNEINMDSSFPHSCAEMTFISGILRRNAQDKFHLYIDQRLPEIHNLAERLCKRQEPQVPITRVLNIEDLVSRVILGQEDISALITSNNAEEKRYLEKHMRHSGINVESDYYN